MQGGVRDARRSCKADRRVSGVGSASARWQLCREPHEGLSAAED